MQAQLEKLKFEKFKNLCVGVLVLIAVLVTVLACIPSFRELVRTLFVYSDREVLARADGDLSGKGDRVTVIKVRTYDTLALEVFFFSENESSREMKRIVLPEKREGYFNFRGQATNLVLNDINGDGTLEIVAPSFDENLIPRLNVFEFDSDLRIFKRRSGEI
jgi:hypothetical protein